MKTVITLTEYNVYNIRQKQVPVEWASTVSVETEEHWANNYSA